MTSWRLCRVAGLAPVDVPPEGRVQLGRWLDKGNLTISRVQAVVTAADGGLLRFESLGGTNPSWAKPAGSDWQSISRGDHIVLGEESQIALHEQHRDGGNTLLTLAAASPISAAAVNQPSAAEANHSLIQAFLVLADITAKDEPNNPKQKSMAYREAASAFGRCTFELTALNVESIGPGGSTKLDGVGPASASKAKEFLETGKIAKQQQYERTLLEQQPAAAGEGSMSTTHNATHNTNAVNGASPAALAAAALDPWPYPAGKGHLGVTWKAGLERNKQELDKRIAEGQFTAAQGLQRMTDGMKNLSGPPNGFGRPTLAMKWKANAVASPAAIDAHVAALRAHLAAQIHTSAGCPTVAFSPVQTDLKLANPVRLTRGAGSVEVQLPTPFMGNSSILVGWFGGKPSSQASRIAGFDFDGTLSDRRAVGGLSKWRSNYWNHLFPKSAQMIRALAANGYAIVVLTNESVDRLKNPKPIEDQLRPKCERLAGWAADIGVPVLVIVAINKLAVCSSTGHTFHKGPVNAVGSAGMWHTAETLLGLQNGSAEGSFYVGDAAGRLQPGKVQGRDAAATPAADHGDDDKRLAESARVQFYTEDVFFTQDPEQVLIADPGHDVPEGSSKRSSARDDWSCAACTFTQSETSVLCEMCGTPRSKRQKLETYPPGAAPGDEAKYAIVLTLNSASEGDQAYMALLEACQRVADPRWHAACFQRSGTRHISLVADRRGSPFKMTAKQAADLEFSSPPDCFPLTVKLDGLMNWKHGIYLRVSPECDALIRPLASGLSGLPQAAKADSDFHLSLYRKRQFKDSSLHQQSVAKVRAELGSLAQSSVSVVGVALKVVGGEYGTSMRLLAGQLG